MQRGRLTIFLLLFALSSAEVSLWAQTLPPPLSRKYQRDAARLALRVSGPQDELAFLPVRIPEEETRTIFAMLEAAYLQLDAVQRVSRCHVHTSPFPPIDQIQVIYRKNAPWARTLGQGVMRVEHPEFNALLRQYDLVLDRVNRWTETDNALTLRGRTPLNMLALAGELQRFPGVLRVEAAESPFAGARYYHCPDCPGI